ncbi:hypothetical protein Droror1_Dr00018227 [Drosera rotundifolia]
MWNESDEDGSDGAFTDRLVDQAVVLLKGDDEQAKDTNQRQMHRTYSEELSDAKEYNSTKYLNVLNQHRLVAFAV